MADVKPNNRPDTAPDPGRAAPIRRVDSEAGTYPNSVAYPDGFSYGYAGGEDGEAQLLNYFRILYRRRWLALSAFSIVLLSVIVYSFAVTPVYEGRVQILIDPENPNVVSFKEVIEQEKATNEYYQTQYTILRSRAPTQRTIEKLGLWSSPELGATKARSGIQNWFSPETSVGRGVEAKVEAPSESVRQSRAIDMFLLNLVVSPIRNSRLVDVRYSSADPRVAAQVANTIAREYIEQNLEFKFMSTKEASDWLGQQLTEQRKRLESSEQALQRYREQGDAVALDDRQNIVVQRLADLNAAVTRARTERIEKEAQYQQLTSLESNRSALDTFPAILANTFIQQLKSQLADLQRQRAQLSDRLGEKHPEMVRNQSEIESTQMRLDREIAKVVQSVRNEFLAAQAQERSLIGDLDRQKADALALNRKGIEYGVLRRETESNQQIYDTLMQRAKETGVAGELKTSNIRVVDDAEVPRWPVRPRKLLNLLLGILAASFVGAGLAFFSDYLDNRIKNPDELKRLGFAFLGMVPAVRAGTNSEAPIIGAGLPQSFNEAFRTIRTSVVFSSASDGSRSIGVTSTQPGEGKTVVASNLAVALAQTGQRVLLVDADMRKPRQHSIFGLRQDPGLSSVLVGQAKISDVIRKTPAHGLWIVAAGPTPPNPAELLGSDRFSRIMAVLSQHFDWLVVDAPPVLAVTDPAVIAHKMTGIVFVVGAEQVNRHMVARAAEQLWSARANVLGAVLNRVNVERDPYYYSHYYRADYANYYHDQQAPS